MASFTFSIGGLIIIFMFMCYMIIGSVLEHKKSIVGHESGLIILIGIGVSYATILAGFD